MRPGPRLFCGMQPASVALVCLLIAVVLLSLAIKKLRQSHKELQQQHWAPRVRPSPAVDSARPGQPAHWPGGIGKRKYMPHVDIQKPNTKHKPLQGGASSVNKTYNDCIYLLMMFIVKSHSDTIDFLLLK